MNIKKLISSYGDPEHDGKKLDTVILLKCGHTNRYPHLAVIEILITKKNDLRCFKCNPS